MLSQEERERFAKYLRDDALSNTKLAEQMKNLPNSPAMQILAQRYTDLAKAETIVANDLVGRESVEVGPNV